MVYNQKIRWRAVYKSTIKCYQESSSESGSRQVTTRARNTTAAGRTERDDTTTMTATGRRTKTTRFSIYYPCLSTASFVCPQVRPHEEMNEGGSLLS